MLHCTTVAEALPDVAPSIAPALTGISPRDPWSGLAGMGTAGARGLPPLVTLPHNSTFGAPRRGTPHQVVFRDGAAFSNQINV